MNQCTRRRGRYLRGRGSHNIAEGGQAAAPIAAQPNNKNKATSCLIVIS